ncbi:response regulator [uncultured Jannaschia sp.]|uniref:response regulator n=1 Tax=uncultured Jannaschia sp. TaxID=293347 RepID=UPI00262C126F|nr:response regulator [uncultured Jannaschia sp.]
MTALRVAYVEDENDIRELTEIALTSFADFTVQTYASGAEALAALEAFAPDLILLDVMMPAMDGKTLFGHITRTEALAEVPVVFMTAKALPAECEELRALGAVGIISKPYDPVTLADQVTELWRAATAPS